MDRDMFKAALQTSLARLPKPMLDDLTGLARKVIVEHRQTIEAVMPSLIAELAPHIGTIAFEKGLGILNIKEVEDDVMEVLGTFGIKEMYEPPKLTPIAKLPLPQLSLNAEEVKMLDQSGLLDRKA
jgi:hypothetical protein